MKSFCSIRLLILIAGLLCAAGFLFGSHSSAEDAAPKWVTVRKAVDGDTLRLVDGRLVRLIGIDAPEIDHKKKMMQPMADRAWTFLIKATEGQKVHLKLGSEVKDRYGRMLAYVYDQNDNLINASILEAGYAYTLFVRPNTEMHEYLLAAQQRAMDHQKGLWQHFYIQKSVFVGNRGSKRFHNIHCPLAKRIHEKNRIMFSSNRDAFYNGFAPCKKCLGIRLDRKLKTVEMNAIHSE